MRKFIENLLLILLVTTVAFGQATQGDPNGSIAISIYQDGSLAFTEDNHGNTPFTLDIRGEFDMQGNQQEFGYMVLGFTTEYARLSQSDFIRYGFQLGYTLNQIFINRLEVTALFGAGVIHRGIGGNISLEATGELGYRITKAISFNLKFTMMQRGDLAVYNDPSAFFNPWDWKPNLYGGIKLHLNKIIDNQ